MDSCSYDSTAEIAKQTLRNSNSSLKWNVVQLNKPGKSVAVNHFLKQIDTELMIMMDADSVCQSNSFKLLADWFVDEDVGAVCGQFDPNPKSGDYPYRSRFNTLRVGESVKDSTPIFEGSICCFRATSLSGKYINEDINADDSQLAMLVRSSGYKALMDPRIKFSETSSETDKSRRIRRGQGIIGPTGEQTSSLREAITLLSSDITFIFT